MSSTMSDIEKIGVTLSDADLPIEPGGTAQLTVLSAANAEIENRDGDASTVQPVTRMLPLASSFDYEAPANSLSILRFKQVGE